MSTLHGFHRCEAQYDVLPNPRFTRIMPMNVQKKRSTTELLGFNDRWLLIVGIPLVAFIVPHVFFANSESDYVGQNTIGYASSLLSTIVYWFGNRQIVLLVRKRFFDHSSEIRRISVQSVLVLGYTMSIGLLSILLMNYIPTTGSER